MFNLFRVKNVSHYKINIKKALVQLYPFNFSFISMTGIDLVLTH